MYEYSNSLLCFEFTGKQRLVRPVSGISRKALRSALAISTDGHWSDNGK